MMMEMLLSIFLSTRVTMAPIVRILEALEQVASRRLDFRAQFQLGQPFFGYRINAQRQTEQVAGNRSRAVAVVAIFLCQYTYSYTGRRSCSRARYLACVIFAQLQKRPWRRSGTSSFHSL
jgi:hypothetical protein